ncbi:nitroreductase family protein [Sulfurovum sp.]|uniref:nitroreductase family protein n=1 Tax=Sulfurovum sp. TaxID=1969726 RepID=UPI0025D2B9EA|nr:nitroreductase family protein [Sulfurovum sp.]
MHPVIKDLKGRHTCKKYDATKKIPKEKLEILYEAMRLSASSINSQPWKFIVLESKEAKERMYQTFAHKYQFNKAHILEASHVILFAHHPHYTREDYAKVVDKSIMDGRIKEQERENAFGGFIFAQINTDTNGYTGTWTKAQLYLALGNTLHTLARLGIDSTCLEGIDTALVNHAFEDELAGYTCEVALAIGYHDRDKDYNAKLPKSRLSKEDIFIYL